MRFIHDANRLILRYSWVSFLYLIMQTQGHAWSSDTVLTCASKEVIPTTYFGMHIHQFHNPKFVPPPAEFGVWRLWDAGVSWSDLEPAKDVWNFNRLDLALTTAELRGIEIGITLGVTPKWASARPSERAFMGEGAAAEPANLDDWDRYVKTLVKRFKGRIKFYEIWNEPGSDGFFSGTTAMMVELSKRAYRSIKAIDPSAIVVTPAPAKESSLPWLRRFLDAGGGSYADVIGYHFYTDQENNPEALISLVQQVQNIVRPRLPTMPIWNTESGLGFSTPEEVYLQSKAGLPSSSAHITRWLTLGWCLGLERFMYYAWDNGTLGLVDNLTGKNRTTLYGWDGAHRWLAGSRMSTCKLSDGVWSCKLEQLSGRLSYIEWSAEQAVIQELRGDDFVIVEDLVGTVKRMRANDLIVTPSPVLVSPN